MKAPQKKLLAWYSVHGRAALPWRHSRNPYDVLVSEFMLQQTQVDRVIPKYEAFLAAFPDFATLARASTADVLRAWKGLGYNSRAIRLKRIAQIVCAEFGGILPAVEATLRRLPGVGAYTAAAVRAFAFHADVVALDTNIRRVLHRVVHGMEYPVVANAQQLALDAARLLPAGRAHDWNSALMDLGATICTARAPKCALCPLHPVCEAAPVDAATLEQNRLRYAARKSPQEAIPFEQTTRFARGKIVDRLRALPPGAAISLLDLQLEMNTILPPHSLGGIENTLKALERDGLVRRNGEAFALTD
ncbi:MAG: A/G-specific adenine glycosylase [Candidatus Eremiobacteraeota bacterium]|nr:A/G-specific adenine glycosylase [Candidatus Eremiobacteraeota bacterium]